MSGTAPKITMTLRSAFTIVRDADVTKYAGQQDIAQVAGLPAVLAERIVSRPPAGFRQVFNIYWDPNDEEFVIEISETDA